MLVNILNNFWLYGGAYFAALATASSFYAIFFFFWTRTGDRKDRIDIETKKIYLMPIYWTLRFSLLMIVLSKIIEVLFVQKYFLQFGLERSFWEIVTSSNGIFAFSILIILMLNSLMMYTRKINFNYGIPIAVITYFFLFLELTRLNVSNVAYYAVEPGEGIAVKVVVYVATLIIGWSLFRFFGDKVRKR